MFRYLLTSSFLTVVFQVAAQTSSLVATTHDPSGFVPEGYELVWNDEFDNGTTLNSSDWTHEMKGKGWVNNELQYYVNHETPNGSLVTEVKDDALVIRCLEEDGKVFSGRVYAKVKRGWTYGYIEGRIKLPKGRGTWPAFWMMPVNFRSWPADGEIDIMEEVGYNPDYVSSSLHANAHVHSNGTQITHEMFCEGAEDGYHIYAIEWTADRITTYVDGRKQLACRLRTCLSKKHQRHPSHRSRTQKQLSLRPSGAPGDQSGQRHLYSGWSQNRHPLKIK